MSSCENATAMVPAPEGYNVDFCNPQRRADIATYWCFGGGMILSILFTAQRLYVKLGIGTGWQCDDTLLTLAWITSLATQTLVVYGFANGHTGVHVWEITVADFNKFLLILYIAAPTYIFAGSCAKIALSIFYLRLSPQRWFRYAVYATIFFIGGYSLGIFFSLIFSCNPVARSYDVTITSGKCISTAGLYIATAVFNIVSDIILFILPIPMVAGLQMKWKQKAGLLFIFGIGSATIVTSILRAAVLPVLLTTEDTSWDVAYASLLVVVEANLIIICGMLPTLRKFVRHMAPKFLGESNYGNNSNRSGPKRASHSPHVATFGSTPSSKKSYGHRGYSKFDRGDEYNIALEPISGTTIQEDEASPPVLGVFRNASKKGRVDTTVMAGGAGGDASGMSNAGRNSIGSRDSQLPIMGAGGTRGQRPGIKATTRIEVSYDVDRTVL